MGTTMKTYTAWLGRFLALALFIGMMAPLAVRADGAEDADKAKDLEKEFPVSEYAFRRMIIGVNKDWSYRRASTPVDKFNTWRSAINYLESRGTPISRRYIVTCYGGVIDMRLFLAAAGAAYVNGTETAAIAQLRQSGGMYSQDKLSAEQLEALAKAGQVPDASPDTIPSVALGALFAERVREAQRTAGYSFEQVFIDLIRPLKPVPDKISTQFSYADLVFNNIPVEERYSWFTATPNVSTKLINAKAAEIGLGKFCDDVENGTEALEKAGYVVVNVGNYPIMLQTKTH